MPTPRVDESEKDFVSRCIPVVINDGTAADGSQAAAICHSMWRHHKERSGEDAPRQELIEQIGQMRVCRVSGNWIRSNRQIEFTNWACHEMFPGLIPENEIWIDQEAGGDRETPAYIASALLMHRLMASGVPHDKALEIANRKGRSVRAKLEGEPVGGKGPLPEAEISPLGMGIHGKGGDAFLCDGDMVRRERYADFTEGGHDLVYDFVPSGHIWIDNDVVECERPYVLLHEATERDAMAAGDDYPVAHARASKAEWVARQQERRVVRHIFSRILFLCNFENDPDEDVPLRTEAENVSHILQSRLPTELVFVSTPQEIEQALARYDPADTLVFNWAEGLPGWFAAGETVTNIVDAAGFAHTASSPASQRIVFDRGQTYLFLDQLGIRTPRFQMIYSPGDAALWKSWPAIIRPNDAHGSEDMRVVASAEEAGAYVGAMMQKHQPPMILVEYVSPAREFSVGVLSDGDAYTVLPIAQANFKSVHGDIKDEDAKSPDSPPAEDMNQVPAPIDDILRGKLANRTKLIMQRLGGKIYFRSDWRLRAGDGEPVCIDVNTEPDICTEGLMAEMAKASGMSYTDFILGILDRAVAYYKGVPGPLARATAHTGAMVALHIPPDVAKTLAIPNGEQPRDMHITLVYLADNAQDIPGGHDRVANIVSTFARKHSTLSGRVQGFARFYTGEGKDACVALFDSPEMPKFRQELVNALGDLMGEQKHGFVPHITLAYIDHGAEMPITEVTTPNITFGSIALAWGEHRYEYYPLLGGSVMNAIGALWENIQRLFKPLIEQESPDRLAPEESEKIGNLVKIETSSGIVQEVNRSMPPLANSSVIISRSPNGKVRYLMVAASAVINRVGAIDSTALFDSFVKRARETGEYPVLDFWHERDDIRLGTVDWVSREGALYLASGTFDDTDIGRAAARGIEDRPDYWGASIMYHTVGTPLVLKAEGEIPVYQDGINTYISIVPRTAAADLFTSIVTRAGEVKSMTQQEYEELVKLVGEDIAKKFIGNVQDTNRAIESAGMVMRSGNNRHMYGPSNLASPGTSDEDDDEWRKKPRPVESGQDGTQYVDEIKKKQEAGEVANEGGSPQQVELTPDAVDAIVQAVMGSEAMTSLANRIAALEQTMGAAQAESERSRKDLDGIVLRVSKLEETDDDKLDRMRHDMPARSADKLVVTYRPRDAHADNQPTQRGKSLY